jgi:hypothetical protein
MSSCGAAQLLIGLTARFGSLKNRRTDHYFGRRFFGAFRLGFFFAGLRLGFGALGGAGPFKGRGARGGPGPLGGPGPIGGACGGPGPIGGP